MAPTGLPRPSPLNALCPTPPSGLWGSVPAILSLPNVQVLLVLQGHFKSSSLEPFLSTPSWLRERPLQSPGHSLKSGLALHRPREGHGLPVRAAVRTNCGSTLYMLSNQQLTEVYAFRCLGPTWTAVRQPCSFSAVPLLQLVTSSLGCF